MDIGLAGKRAIITGGTRGIGSCIADLLANEGCDVSICARTKTELEAKVLSLQKRGGRAFGATLDIRNKTALEHWISESAEKFGGLDILISNVSAQSRNWELCFEVDIMGSINIVEASIPHLRRSASGAIVAIATRAALLNVPSFKAYSAMKAALISYMSSLSKEYAPSGLRVNIVSPGEVYFEGGFWHRMQLEDPELFCQTLARSGPGRFARPEEIAQVVVFLASPSASYVSGANLIVDFAGRDHVDF